jgi:hypothetical protein
MRREAEERKEVTMQREAEERKEATARKVEAERRAAVVRGAMMGPSGLWMGMR